MNATRRLFGPMRVPFLALTVVCVGLGIATAQQATGEVAWRHAALALTAALAAHVSVNALNEYLDFRSGLDLRTARTPYSGGSGTLPADPSAAPIALAVAVLALFVAVSSGLWLVAERGRALVPLGVMGVVLVLAYTTWLTRHPVACLIAPGLGFGPLVVVGTHIAAAGRYDAIAGVAALVPFFLVDALLLLNQFPDVEADRIAGRRHAPIAWGRPRAAQVLAALYALAYATILAAVVWNALPLPCLLGLLTSPLALLVTRDAVKHADEPGSLAPALRRNAIVCLSTPALVALGLVL